MSKKKKGKGKWPIFISITLLLLVNFGAHTAWFNPFAIISNGDWLYIYPESLSLQQQAAWVSSKSYYTAFGGPNLFPLNLLLTSMGQVIAFFHGNEQILNMLLFSLPTFLASVFGMYFFLLKFTKNYFSSLVGALFYTFSTIYLVNSSGGYPFIFVYAFFPLLFLIFDSLLRNFSFKNILLFILISAYLNFLAIHLMLIVYGLFFVYMLFLWKTEGKYFSIKKFIVQKWKNIIFFSLIGFGTNFHIFLFSFSESFKSSVASGITSRALIIPGYLFWDNALTTFYPFWTGAQPTMFFNQPVLWYFWIIPLYVFSSIFFIRKNKYIVFFLCIAILMVFLGKGPSDPLGKVYEIAYDYVPFFNIYREASKFWTGIMFSYAVLIALTITYTFSFLDTKYHGLKNLSLKLVFILPLLIIIFLTAKPAFTKELGSGYVSYTIPEEYKKLADYFSNDEHFYRILQIPAFSRLMFFSEIHPRLSYNDLPVQLQSIDPAILRLYAVKYILLPSDPYFDVFPGNSNRSVYKAGIKEKKDLVSDTAIVTDKVSLYKNSAGTVPHIYPITTVNAVSGEMKNIHDIYPLFGNQKSDFHLVPDSKEKINTPIHPQEHIILSSCLFCTNTTASESSTFSSFITEKEGYVEIFIKKYGIKDITLFIDKENIALDTTNSIYFKASQYLSKGSHEVSVILQRENLAEDPEVKIVKDNKVTFSIPETKLLDHTPYTFSFDYKIPKGLLVHYILDQSTDFYFQHLQNKPGGTPWKAAKGEISGEDIVKQFSTSFTTLFNPEWMQFTVETPKKSDISKLAFNNISLIANITPQIMIKEAIQINESTKKSPEIVFQQINPTKYIVKVKNAKHPFILVFAESYNKNWQASYSDVNVNLGKNTKVLSTEMENVKEIPYKNSYDIDNLLFSKSKENRTEMHFQINGYANAWYLDKSGDFTVVLEFKPQREFMTGILITGISFFVCLIILIIFIYRSKKKGYLLL